MWWSYTKENGNITQPREMCHTEGQGEAVEGVQAWLVSWGPAALTWGSLSTAVPELGWKDPSSRGPQPWLWAPWEVWPDQGALHRCGHWPPCSGSICEGGRGHHWQDECVQERSISFRSLLQASPPWGHGCKMCWGASERRGRLGLQCRNAASAGFLFTECVII